MRERPRVSTPDRLEDAELPPVDRPVDLGELLRRARLAKQLSLAQVERDLRIRQRTLRAMEESNFTVIASAVHARGLLRLYAGHLDLDPERALALLDERQYWPDPVTVLPATCPTNPRSSLPSSLVITLTIIFLLGGLIYYLAQQYSAFVSSADFIPEVIVREGIAAPPPAPSPSPRVVLPPIGPPPVSAASAATPTSEPTPMTPTPTAIPTEMPPPTPSPSPTATPAAALVLAVPTVPTVEIQVQVSGRTWTQVEIDGEKAFEGFLVAGDRRTWVGKREIFLWVGNAGAVEVGHNGKPLGKLGAIGEVVKVRWSAS
ncbi:MAG: DUF4115 domain-containing protein [Chloroflexi bacterium]|nr:DUF4115 domain-containing protein [Chloroflexota bacterium]